ncbi:class I SAM-dependent methyltransferase [Tsuneonella mangrovi]|uniref:class I SAM-dependent methyltransferase n=1 Tax=Tsuneonella mangrovi TaxID=1982042 RepID=UPI000BA2B61E|nr:class I SAM-dependent methyltransferase [Tsuneonella mangrovi]
MASYLSNSKARRFYDLVGRIEDTQAFYEDPALDILVARGHFENATSMFEFGCGTGRLAERLLSGPLPPDAGYTACDISPKMVSLARARIAKFGNRASAFEASGDAERDFGEGHVDRVVTAYVLDLLSPADISAFLSAAAKHMLPGGLLCAASIAPGETLPSSVIMGVWARLHGLAPILTGGCRPIALRDLIGAAGWNIIDAQKVAAWGVTSQVVIASPPLP